MSSTTVQPTFSTLTPLRPFEGFEAVYQGADGLRPVLFPGGRSELAGGGSNGIMSDLAASHPVPLGSRAFIYLPVLPTGTLYAWSCVWQVLPSEIGVATKKPHHMGGAGFGTPDLSDVVSRQRRYPILGAVTSVGYEQVEPAPSNPARLLMYREEVIPATGGSLLSGLLPGGQEAVYEQGIFGASLNVFAIRRPNFIGHAVDCLGDALIIGARKYMLDNSPPAPWDFAMGGEDYEFAQAFGASTYGTTTERYPYSAIYVATGSNP